MNDEAPAFALLRRGRRMTNAAFGSQASCLTRPTRLQRVASTARATSKMLVGRDKLEAYHPTL